MEVLAHISAPTSKSDDDRYAAQAIAYLDFEPATVQNNETHVQPAISPEHSLEAVLENPKSTHENLQKRDSWTMKTASLSATPFQRLEAVHGRWRERNMQQTLKRPFSAVDTPAPTTNTLGGGFNGKLRNEIFLDTQSAAAAVESQINSPPSQIRSGSSPSSFSRDLKRRRLSARSGTQSHQLSSSPQLCASSSSPDKPTTTEPKAGNGWWSSPDPPISSQLPDTYGFSVSSPSATPSTERRQSSLGDFDTPVLRRIVPSSKPRTSSALQISSSPISGLTVRLVCSQQHIELESSPLTGLWRKPASSPVLLTASMSSTCVGIVSSQMESAVCAHSTPDSAASGVRDGKIFEDEAVVSCAALSRKWDAGAFQEVPKRFAASLAASNAALAPSNTGRTPIRDANDWSTLPTKVDPGPPEVDCLDWSLRPTHVSTKLSSLSHRSTSQLLRKYQPEYQRRELDPWERGYWVFGTAGWNAKIQRSCWEYLTEFVGSGKAGYATRVERTTGPNEDGLGTVTVWCFGDEVKHIYLLLYAASLSRIRNCRAEWRSWSGEVIVRMSSVARLPSKPA